MKCRSAIRTDIETRLATDTSFFIRCDCIGFGNALSGTCRANRDAGSLFALLTDNGHEDRDLFPFLHSYPRKGRAAGAVMGKAAGHFTRLTSCAAFRENRDGAHFNVLLYKFSIVNNQLFNILTYMSYLSSFFSYLEKKFAKEIYMFTIVNALMRTNFSAPSMKCVFGQRFCWTFFN
jgi:hypothetical protein